MWDPAGALVNHVSIQCRDQGLLLEEANRDLEVFKKAYYKAERDMHDREARFDQEKKALFNEIHQLKVRLFLCHSSNLRPSMSVSTFRTTTLLERMTTGVDANCFRPPPPFRR
jgi:hypothetical protein